MPGLDREFMRLKVAKAWHMSPLQFRLQPPDDQAAMIAFEMFGDTCEAYRWEWKEVQRELTKGGKESGANAMDLMRANMGLGRAETLAEKIDRKMGIKNAK